MVVLDLTIMNVALPSAQRALGFSTVDRQWVVTAYTLAFGSLLLLGGRLADLLGRKVTFLAGLAGFAGVSAIGGASVNFAMLITARACQGAFAALLVPSALSLLTTTFTTQKDRGKAFGIYGAIAGAGGAVGLLPDRAQAAGRVRNAGRSGRGGLAGPARPARRLRRRRARPDHLGLRRPRYLPARRLGRRPGHCTPQYDTRRHETPCDRRHTDVLTKILTSRFGKNFGLLSNPQVTGYTRWGERGDSNPRHPGPQPGALTN
jgi:Major Facilitator Superfamily